MTASVMLAEITRRAWDIRLEEPYYRLRAGQAVERLPSGSLEEAETGAAMARELLGTLHRLDLNDLAPANQLTHGFLAYFLREAGEARKRWFENFPVTPYNAGKLVVPLQSVFPALPLQNAADAERYVALLQDYGAMIENAERRLTIQAAQGWRIPRPAVDAARSTIERLRSMAPKRLIPDKARFSGAAANQRAAWLKDTHKIIGGVIGPAFDRLLDRLGSDYEAAAPEALGLWQYRGGEDAYQRAIRTHLTIDMAPDALHDVGIAEVARLTAEMAELRERMGGGEEIDFHQQLRANPRSFATSPEALEATYRGHLARLQPLLPDYFRRTPKAAYGVQRLGPELEAGMTYGYYQPPLAAGTPGLYRYNGSGLDERLQLNAAALIFHELVPGHHFHLALQSENETLPAIRREAVDIGVFNEGWAEYAASLGTEMGLYDDDHDRYGRMLHERFLAARLVVDTGLNAFGWSSGRAQNYLARNTLEAAPQIQSEVNRYAADMPGQALCYHFGYARFKALRRRAADLAGPGFDIRDFHDTILDAGALPLPVLDAHIEATFAGAGAR